MRLKGILGSCLLLATVFFSSAGLPESKDDTLKRKTFVLIHGSWHSAWNWYKVTPLLEKMGHRVIAPDLPAMGRDKTPVEDVRFDKTVKLLCEVIDQIKGKVVLVGHSKNGVLISQIAENRPEKIEKLVYLAAVLGKDGTSAVDYFKLDKNEILGPHIIYDSLTNSSMLLPRIYKKGLYHDCTDEITEMAKIILGPEPRQTATAKISISGKNYGSVPRYYIECTEDRAITPELQ
ncbi:alpha/beta fold hydrolase [Flagellimonas olearia]|uniref:Alpha/beta fold hydrolase n=1 Tax=Flagellimonas olearia TaxID=552546 RepID=A0A6I1E3E7_9FLAO|nr:alpha/beta fold hydrolase [Allomuricauda olearia]KAB7530365.1 alpha/beta fold hydrolase [Allomuricauda olearia]